MSNFCPFPFSGNNLSEVPSLLLTTWKYPFAFSILFLISERLVVKWQIRNMRRQFLTCHKSYLLSLQNKQLYEKSIYPFDFPYYFFIHSCITISLKSPYNRLILPSSSAMLLYEVVILSIQILQVSCWFL